MDARANIQDKWDELLTALGVAAQLHLVSNDEGRSAAILQLSAVLKFLEQTDEGCPTSPLRILLRALRDLEGGAKPAKMLTPSRSKNRPRHDVVLRTVKIEAAVIMDQLHEHAKLSRSKAAEAVAKVFRESGLSDYRGLDISATTIEKWRDQAKEAPETSEMGREFRRIRSIDAEILAKDAPLENKRDFLVKLRLPVFLTQFGAQGQKARKMRQGLILEIGRRIPKKPTF